MLRALRHVVVVGLLAVACGGCETEGTAGSAEREGSGGPPAGSVDEEQQGIEAGAARIEAYCEALVRHREDPSTASRPSRAAKLAAGRAVDKLVAEADEYDGSEPYEEQYEVRTMLVSLADYLEQQDCLRPLVPRVDRALRRMPLSTPPDPGEEEVPPEPEDYDTGADDPYLP